MKLVSALLFQSPPHSRKLAGNEFRNLVCSLVFSRRYSILFYVDAVQYSVAVALAFVVVICGSEADVTQFKHRRNATAQQIRVGRNQIRQGNRTRTSLRKLKNAWC